MARPQKEQGYTPIAHEILEEIAKHRLNGTQLRIILIVWRYTYGFNRKEHAMSIGFIAEALGVRKNRIETELNTLIVRNVLHAKGNGNRARILSFNKDYDSWSEIEEYPRIQGYGENVHTPEYRDTIPPNTGASIPPNSGTKKERKKNIKKGDIYMSKIQFLDTVYLTQEEYDRLINDYGQETVDLFIAKLDEWQTNYPKKAKKDHNKTIRVWIRTEQAKQKQFAANLNKPSARSDRIAASNDYDYNMALDKHLREGGDIADFRYKPK